MDGSSATTSPEVALLAFGLVLSLTACATAPLALALMRWAVPGRAVFFARWGFSHLILAVLAFVLTLLVTAPMHQGILSGMLCTALSLGAAAWVAASAARRLQPEGLGALGLQEGGNLRPVLAGVGAYALLLPSLAGLGMLAAGLLEQLGVDAEPQEVLLKLLELSGPQLVLAVGLATVVGPLLEEVVFRSFLQPLLVQNFGDRGGIVLTSLLFAVIHGNVAACAPIFALSLLLGGVMLRTRRLAAVWAVHGLHNSLMLALAFLVPQSQELLP